MTFIPKNFASFYTATGGATGISTTATTLVLASTRVSSGIFSLETNAVTINKDGYFKFTFDCYFNNSGTSRSEYSFYLERDSGGGYIEETASRFAVYARGYDSGQSITYNEILNVSSGDKFRFRVLRTDGGTVDGYQDDNGTRLIIEEK